MRVLQSLVDKYNNKAVRLRFSPHYHSSPWPWYKQWCSTHTKNPWNILKKIKNLKIVLLSNMLAMW